MQMPDVSSKRVSGQAWTHIDFGRWTHVDQGTQGQPPHSRQFASVQYRQSYEPVAGCSADVSYHSLCSVDVDIALAAVPRPTLG